MRDHWWGLMEERKRQLTDRSKRPEFEIPEDRDHQAALHSSKIAIYHAVFPDEGFEASASTLLKLVRLAQENRPNSRRALYIDIDGHRNKEGGYDNDMFELQRYFLLGFLMPYLAELHAPLISAQNTNLQRNDLPSELQFMKDFNREDIVRAIDAGVDGIWLSEKDVWFQLSKSKNA